MTRTKNVPGNCAHCGKGLTFPADSLGQRATCPHCGKESELTLAIPESQPTVSMRTIVLGVVAIVILVLGLIGAFAALKRAQKWAADHQAPAGANR